MALGLVTEKITASALLQAVKKTGRTLGAVRLTSEIDALNLPFQKTSVARYLSVKGAGVSLDLQRFLRALLQNAHISLARLRDLEHRVEEVEETYARLPDSEAIHGKDAVCIIAAVLAKLGADEADVCRLLWTSFEAAFVEHGSVLETVEAFLQN